MITSCSGKCLCHRLSLKCRRQFMAQANSSRRQFMHKSAIHGASQFVPIWAIHFAACVTPEILRFAQGWFAPICHLAVQSTSICAANTSLDMPSATARYIPYGDSICFVKAKRDLRLALSSMPQAIHAQKCNSWREPIHAHTGNSFHRLYLARL